MLYNIVFIKTAISVIILHSLLWFLIMSKLIAVSVILQDYLRVLIINIIIVQTRVLNL